jgi:hypothetical protein
MVRPPLRPSSSPLIWTQANLAKLIGTEKEVKKLLSHWKLSCTPLCELLVVQLAVSDRTILKTLSGQPVSLSLGLSLC